MAASGRIGCFFRISTSRERAVCSGRASVEPYVLGVGDSLALPLRTVGAFGSSVSCVAPIFERRGEFADGGIKFVRGRSVES